MLYLDRNTVLQCSPRITVSIQSGTGVQAQVGGRRVDCGPHALTVLDVFSRPTSLTEALDSLKARVTGAQDWVELTSTIIRFVQAGVLRNREQMPVTVGLDPFSFDGAPEHVAMLNDRVRTSRFMHAISEAVRPGDVVVEIGTGTGILAIAAARAGARHVYAIEAGAIARAARAVIEANGLQERITLVEGWSTEVCLPERCDVLVSEIIGNDPLDEGVIEFIGDAVRRLLKPNARLVPSHVRILGLPVTIPQERFERRTFSKQAVLNWHSWYDIDFDPLHQAACNSPHFFFMWPQLARDWPVLGDPIPLAELDLTDGKPKPIDNSRIFAATASGRLNGMIVYFEADLSPTTDLSTHPALAGSDNSWSSPAWMFPDGYDVEAGNKFEVRYTYRVPGSRNGLTLAPITEAAILGRAGHQT